MRSVRQARCPNCGGDGRPAYADLRDHVYGAPGTWNMQRCTVARCGVYWLDPLPHPDDLSIAYADYHTHAPDPPLSGSSSRMARVRDAFVARRLGKQLPSGKLARWASNFFPLLGDRSESALYAHFYLPPQPGGRLLEIGSGTGQQLETMVADGWVACGVDFDPQAVAVARSRSLDVRLGDVREIDFDDASFDAIVMAQVIEHVYDPVGLLARCARLLRPGGKLISITPNAASLGHRLYGRDWRGLEPPRHLVIYTASALRLACERAGLTVERIDVTARDAANLMLASRRIRAASGDTVIERPRSDRRPHWLLRVIAALERIAVAVGVEAGEELVLTARRPE